MEAAEQTTHAELVRLIGYVEDAAEAYDTAAAALAGTPSTREVFEHVALMRHHLAQDLDSIVRWLSGRPHIRGSGIRMSTLPSGMRSLVQRCAAKDNALLDACISALEMPLTHEAAVLIRHHRDSIATTSIELRSLLGHD